MTFRCRRCAQVVWILLFGIVAPAEGDPFGATLAERISVPAGFHVEQLYSVPNDEQGSWVVLTCDPQGRLLTSDQHGQLYRITPPTDDQPIEVAPLTIQLGNAQGLLYAFDALYVMVNHGPQRGLHRATDTNGDDQFDKTEYLIPLDGEGEHGPHTILLAPDMQSLVICAGNHTKLPKLTGSRVPHCWDEDQLLKRFWDPNGHAAGLMAPGGWICRVSPDGRQRELLAIGFRNEYDCAFDAAGELFSYDADMEWDLGTAWYRPTRILHVTSGAEFGWRGGCYKWPAYVPDSCPSVIDLGPGSPTGLTFGTGARFPTRYQRALFACDWGRGVMTAIHLKSAGSSFSAEAEPFVTAQALPLTDVVINPHDGAMYFTTGGRRIQSGLYRVTYRGTAADANQSSSATPESDAVTLRKRMEALHDDSSPPAAMDQLWLQLSHSDRRVRYAARVALEHQPIENWLPRAVGQSQPLTLLAAAIATTRVGNQEQVGQLLTRLPTLDYAELSHIERLHLLRAYELALVRHAGAIDAPQSAAIVRQLDSFFPSTDSAENRELAKLLAHLQAPQIISRILDHLESLPSTAEKTHYLLALHNTSTKWTEPDFRRYLIACCACKRGSGGKSYAGYIDRMVTSIETLAGELNSRLSQELAAARSDPQPQTANIARPLVQKWQLDDLKQHLANGSLKPQSGDADNGRELFTAVNCAKCHRVNGAGGATGPDLSTIGRRFNPLDLVTTIVDPDREISDQYRSSIFELATGKVINGRVVDQSDDVFLIRTDMYNPGMLTRINREAVQSVRPSPTSLMPSGLLDTLTLAEIQDLLAYLYQTPL